MQGYVSQLPGFRKPLQALREEHKQQTGGKRKSIISWWLIQDILVT